MTLKNVFELIRRDPVTLVTNMVGLSLGLSASLLLILFIQFELSYDQHFSNKERIFQLNSVWIQDGERTTMPINLREAYLEIPEQVAGIESTVQIYRGFKREVSRGENRFKELTLLYADPEFFRVFDLKSVEGDLSTALTDPGSVVLTRAVAEKIFGKEPVSGRVFEMENETYTVSAVVEDIPPNTSFKFDLLMPMQTVEWLDQLQGLEFFTYYLLEPGVDQSLVLQQICRENTSLLEERFSDFQDFSFDSGTEALTRLHLHSSASMGLVPAGNMKRIVLMVVIAVTVMVLALSNFINLYILNGARRSVEIGIRKVNGAKRRQLIYQFYLETAVVVTIAFAVGAFISLLLLPEFGRFMQRASFLEITSSTGLYFIIFALYLVTILLSGCYPALLLSKADPIPLMHGQINPAGEKKWLLRLVSILQLAIAVFLLTALFGTHLQTRFLKELNPGYDPEGIALIYNLNDKLMGNYNSIREQLLEFPEIVEVSASSHTIGAGSSGQGIRWAGEPEDRIRAINEYRIQPGLCSLYRFSLVAGRFFQRGRVSDRNALILNESAVKMLESTPEEIIGESLVMFDEPLQVVGVIRDFHYQSAAREIEPLVLTAYSTSFRVLCVRFQAGMDPGEALERIGTVIRSFDPDYIMTGRFATDIYDQYYKAENRLQKIIGAGSLLALIIVLLGIFALVTHHILSRTKEIGIRKVLGGSTRQMVALILFSTLKWTVISTALALPLAWLYLTTWLEDYALRIPLSWWIFLLPVVSVAMVQTLLTVGKTWKTANSDPVESLRYE